MTEFSDLDIKFMNAAIHVARRGIGRTAPNPSVGAVIVEKNEATALAKPQWSIISRARTGDGGAPHAEVAAIEQAGNRAKGASLYVTLEPCNHTGRTPPCTDAIIASGIREVIIACGDTDARVAGSGIEKLQSSNLIVRIGCLHQSAAQLINGHTMTNTNDRPYIIGKIAIGSNDLVAPGDSENGPSWVTGELARNRGHLMRAESDAILIGWNTAEIDHPSLTSRLPGMENQNPRPIILDSNLRLNPANKLLQRGQEPAALLVTTPHQIPAKVSTLQYQGVEVLEVERGNDDHVDLELLIPHLTKAGIRRILVEGGPKVLESFLTANLIDELAVFKGEEAVENSGLLPFGTHDISWPTSELGFTEKSSQELGRDTLTIYTKAPV